MHFTASCRLARLCALCKSNGILRFTRVWRAPPTVGYYRQMRIQNRGRRTGWVTKESSKNHIKSYKIRY